MRLTRVFLACVILFASCSTKYTLTKDTAVADDQDVYFFLKDGSYVRSSEEKHYRLENGYHVSGFMTRRQGGDEKFEGFIPDGDIERITVVKFSAVRAAIIVFGIIVVGLLFLAGSTGSGTFR